MWQNLIIVIADEVSAVIDHAMKEIPAAALLYLLYYYREISNLLFVFDKWYYMTILMSFECLEINDF